MIFKSLTTTKKKKDLKIGYSFPFLKHNLTIVNQIKFQLSFCSSNLKAINFAESSN